MTDAPIFEREYDIEGLEEKALLRIFDPKPDRGDWTCEVFLSVPYPVYEEKRFHMPGTDRLDAVAMALNYAAANLQCLPEELSREVSWTGGPEDLVWN